MSCIVIFTFITGIATLGLFKAPSKPTQENVIFPTKTTEPSAQDVVPILSADYLFSDDFETGIKTDWHAIAGEWRMINGNLQAISGDPAIIGVGNSSWNDYVIEAKIGGLRNTVSSAKQFLETNPNVFYIGARQDSSASDGYWFGVTHWKQSCKLEINNEETALFYSEENRIGEGEHTIKLEVVGDLFKFYIDGSLLCSFIDSTIGNGEITIAMYPGSGSDPSFPWLEYIRVAEK